MPLVVQNRSYPRQKSERGGLLADLLYLVDTAGSCQRKTPGGEFDLHHSKVHTGKHLGAFERLACFP